MAFNYTPIGQLPTAGTLSDDDYIPVSQGGTARKMSAASFRGATGPAPVKGVDYFTDAEKTEFAERVENEILADAQSAVDAAAQSAQSAAAQASAAQSAESAARNWALAAQSAADTSESTSRIYDPFAVLTASGNPAEIDDGADNIPVKNLTVEIPVTQSGSGEPYPPGGGKNLLPYPYAFYNSSTRTVSGVTFTDHGDGRITANGTASAQIDYRISEDRASQLSESDTNNLFTLPPGDYILSDGVSDSSASGYFVFINVHRTDDSQKGIAQSYGSGRFTVSENDETFQNFRIAIQIKSGVTLSNVTFYPMIRKADAEDDSWAPYFNVRPFAGFDSVTVRRTADADSVTMDIPDGLTYIGGVLDVKSGKLNATHRLISDVGTLSYGKYNTPSNTFWATISPGQPMSVTIPVLLGGNRYTRVTSWTAFCAADAAHVYYTDNQNSRLIFRDFDYDNANAFKNSLTGISYCYPLTAPSDVQLTQNVIDALLGTHSAETVYLEPVGESDGVIRVRVRYERTVTVSMGDAGTVYGGALDVTNGVLTLNTFYARILSDDSALTFSDNYSPQLRRAGFPANMDNTAAGWCSHFPGYAGGFANLPDQRCLGGSTTVGLRDDRLTCLDAWKSWLREQEEAGTPVEVVWPLKTPVTYQLAPQELKTLLGVNDITSDAGTVTTDYRADSTILYQKLHNALISLGENL